MTPQGTTYTMQRLCPRNCRGAVAFELVMVVPVLVFSLMFIVHVGVSLSGAVLVHQAANAAARSAAESVRASANAATLVSGVTTVANTVLAAGGISTDSSAWAGRKFSREWLCVHCVCTAGVRDSCGDDSCDCVRETVGTGSGSAVRLWLFDDW